MTGGSVLALKSLSWQLLWDLGAFPAKLREQKNTHAFHIKCPKPTRPCFTETSGTNFFILATGLNIYERVYFYVTDFSFFFFLPILLL